MTRHSWGVLITALLSACALGTTVDVATWGYTRCVVLAGQDYAQGVSWVRAELAGTADFRPILAHEAHHAAVMRLYRSCREYERQADRLRIEAEAFCAAARVRSREQDEPMATAIRYYARWLARGYEWRLSVDSAAALIGGACDYR